MTIVQARAPSNRSVASLSYRMLRWGLVVSSLDLRAVTWLFGCYMHIYIYICNILYTYVWCIYTYIQHTYIYTHSHECMHACMQTDRQTEKNIYIHYTYMYDYVCIYIYICISISFHANSCGLCRRCIPSKKWYSTDWTPNAPWCVFIRPDETSKLGAY